MENRTKRNETNSQEYKSTSNKQPNQNVDQSSCSSVSHTHTLTYTNRKYGQCKAKILNNEMKHTNRIHSTKLQSIHTKILLRYFISLAQRSSIGFALLLICEPNVWFGINKNKQLCICLFHSVSRLGAASKRNFPMIIWKWCGIESKIGPGDLHEIQSKRRQIL